MLFSHLVDAEHTCFTRLKRRKEQQRQPWHLEVYGASDQIRSSRTPWKETPSIER